MALTLWLGLLLTLVAGLFSGSCMMPMKFAKRWPWENTWLVFTLVSLLILPWTLAFTLLFLTLHLVRMRTEILKRRAETLERQVAASLAA